MHIQSPRRCRWRVVTRMRQPLRIGKKRACLAARGVLHFSPKIMSGPLSWTVHTVPRRACTRAVDYRISALSVCAKCYMGKVRASNPERQPEYFLPSLDIESRRGLSAHVEPHEPFHRVGRQAAGTMSGLVLVSSSPHRWHQVVSGTRPSNVCGAMRVCPRGLPMQP